MTDNYIFPFLWIHGETEDMYRKMVGVIYDANIRAFCVEARPHPGFVQEQWWKDLEIILDEAEKRGMKVWILDDKHFPTGFAAGAVKKAPLKLKRQTMIHKSISVSEGQKVNFSIDRQIKPHEKYGLVGTAMFLYGNEMHFPKKKKADQLLSCTAYGQGKRIDLSDHIENGSLKWKVPEGKWSIEICGLTYDSGIHRDYINMIDEDSCKLLIDAVYEPHYVHFKDKFGTVVAGFFSDEPELGNGNYLKHYNYLGTDQSLPYSEALAEKLQKILGADWKLLMPLLWKNDGDKQETAKVRYLYMDAVTRLVEECFSRQIGMWCREHGVEYIGHVIEDNNQHARTGTSLGHYFRGLKWQSMAGIDDIGGQVYPDKEDAKEKNIFGYYNDGEFYHFALGKLGSSLGMLNPNMKGRTMCEIFGNYGWQEGVWLEKYLLDHFMVRGVNRFVPHAFTCSTYPEKDCPPHFYAQGHNPLYRHFGELMKYANRVCGLISGGSVQEKIAILYHGEAEWTGKCMLMQKPGRVLTEHQVDFCYLPSDVFEEREFYHTKIGKELRVNGTSQRLVIVPYAEFLNKACAEGLSEFILAGGKVIFIDGLPTGISTGEKLPEELKKAKVVALDGLMDYICENNLQEVQIFPENKQIRVMHYRGAQNLYYVVNESAKEYQGRIRIPDWDSGYYYDAWNDTVSELEADQVNGLPIILDSHGSLFLIEGEIEKSGKKIVTPIRKILPLAAKKKLSTFELSICDALSYPAFHSKEQVTALEGYEKIDKKFSGYIRYEADIQLEPDMKNVFLEITNASEGVEVFVNGKSCGIQVNPVYRYNLSNVCHPGKNQLAIEVATTLERERGKRTSRSGITGEVNLHIVN